MGNVPNIPLATLRPVAEDETLEFFWDESPMGPATSSYTISTRTILGPYAPISQTVDSSIKYLKISSLLNHTPYAFQIFGTNSYGDGLPVYFRTVQPGFVPNPVTSTTATVLSNAAVQIGWTGPIPDVNIPSTGWFVVQSISSSPSDPEIRVNTYGFESTAVISSLNVLSMYSFNVYAVNDPGYSLAVSTIAISPVIGGDLYTYFSIVTVSGSNDYYYRIYNSQTGWGAPIDTNIDSTQYTYENSNGGGSNYLYGMFYNPTTSNYAVPFVNTTGIPLQTMTWSDSNDNGFALPNSYSNDTFFSYSSNYDTGLLDLQLYQPDTGLYQSTSIIGFSYNGGPPINSIPLQNSVAILTGSNDGMAPYIVHYIWSVTQSDPINLYKEALNLETNTYPVNSNTGTLNIAAIYNTNYYDSINYITEPNTYTRYNLTPNTYTNYRSYVSLPYGNNNNNSFTASLYNSHTTLYDVFVWNNFSNSSNFLNPIILSNIDIVRYIVYNGTPYLATYNTNALLLYDFNLDTYTSNYIGIGTSYSVFDNGSTYSTLFTSTNLAIGNGNFVITSNATGVLQVDSNNNIGIALCSQVFGQSTIVLSSATGYASNFSSYIYLLNGYTNFISVNIPQVDGVYSNFITIRTDTGAITASSANTGISTQTYCGSTGMVLYSNHSCDVLFNGIITSNISTIDSVWSPQPDFAAGNIYGTYYDGTNLNLYTAKPDRTITSTVTAFPGASSISFLYRITPSTFFINLDNPARIVAQSLDNTQTFYSTYGATGSTTIINYSDQSDSACFEILDSDTNYRTNVVFNYTTNTFNEYVETNTIIEHMITTSPYS